MVFLIQVGVVKKEVVFKVLDIPLSYNIFLRGTWIHDIKVVPSTYHQCIKFPFTSIEVSIPRDTSMSINTLTKSLVPYNRDVEEKKDTPAKCEK